MIIVKRPLYKGTAETAMYQKLLPAALVGLALLAGDQLGRSAQAQDHPPLKQGDKVLVTADSTKLMLRGKEVAQLAKGDKLEVAKVQGAWVAGYVVINGKKLFGWLRAADVALPERTVPRPRTRITPPAAKSTLPLLDPSVKLPPPADNEQPTKIVDLYTYLDNTPHYHQASPKARMLFLATLLRAGRIRKDQTTALIGLLTTEYVERSGGDDPQRRLAAWRELDELQKQQDGRSEEKFYPARYALHTRTLLDLLKEQPQRSAREEFEFLRSLPSGAPTRDARTFCFARALLEETRDVPLEKRGMALLKLGQELNLSWGVHASSAQDRGLALYTAFDPAFAKLSLADKIADIHRIYEEELIHVVDSDDAKTLLILQMAGGDPDFASADPAGKKDIIERLKSEGKIPTPFSMRDIDAALKFKISDPYGYLQSNKQYQQADALGRLKIIAEIVRAKALPGHLMRQRASELAFEYVEQQRGGKPNGEMDAWRKLAQLSQRDQPLDALRSNGALRIGDLVHLSYTSAIISSDAYRRGDDRALLEMLAQYSREWVAPDFDWREFILARLVHKETGSLPASQRGLARLRFLASVQGKGYANSTRVLVSDALALHLLYNQQYQQAAPADKLAYLAKLANEKQIDWINRRTFELPWAIKMLAADKQFLAKSNDERKAYLEKLADDGVISNFSDDSLIEVFVEK